MTCKQIKPQLSAYIDGVLPAVKKEQVEAHLADCPICRKELADLKETVALLRAAPKTDAPDKFLQQVNAQIDIQQGAFSIWARVRQFLFVPFKIRIPIQLAAATAMAVLVIMVVTSPEMKRVSETTLQKYAKTDAGKQSAHRSAEQPAVMSEADDAAPAMETKKQKTEIFLNAATHGAESATEKGYDAEMAGSPAASSEELAADSRVEEPVATGQIVRYSAPSAPSRTLDATVPEEGMTDMQRQLLAAHVPAPRKSLQQAAPIQEVSEPMALAEATNAPPIAKPLLITLIPRQRDKAAPAPQMMAVSSDAPVEMGPKEMAPSADVSFDKAQPDDLLGRTQQEVIALVAAAGGKIIVAPVIPNGAADETTEKTMQIPEGQVSAIISAVIPTESYAEFFRQLETLGRCESGTASDLTIVGGNIKITIKLLDPPGN